MYRTTLAALLVAGVAMAAMPESSDAAQTRAKAKRTADSQTVSRRADATSRSGDSYQPIPGVVGARDRSTYYLPNGRINGKEFMEQMQERTNGTGQ